MQIQYIAGVEWPDKRSTSDGVTFVIDPPLFNRFPPVTLDR